MSVVNSNFINLDSDAEWKKFKDTYDSDKKWIQSQFVPLNYLFEKLKAIEDETKVSRVSSGLDLFSEIKLDFEMALVDYNPVNRHNKPNNDSAELFSK